MLVRVWLARRQTSAQKQRPSIRVVGVLHGVYTVSGPMCCRRDIYSNIQFHSLVVLNLKASSRPYLITLFTFPTRQEAPGALYCISYRAKCYLDTVLVFSFSLKEVDFPLYIVLETAENVAYFDMELHLGRCMVGRKTISLKLLEVLLLDNSYSLDL